LVAQRNEDIDHLTRFIYVYRRLLQFDHICELRPASEGNPCQLFITSNENRYFGGEYLPVVALCWQYCHMELSDSPSDESLVPLQSNPSRDVIVKLPQHPVIGHISLGCSVL